MERKPYLEDVAGWTFVADQPTVELCLYKQIKMCPTKCQENWSNHDGSGWNRFTTPVTSGNGAHAHDLLHAYK